MHKVARIKREGDDRFVVHHPDKGVLRYGHDVRACRPGLSPGLSTRVCGIYVHLNTDEGETP